MLTAIRAGLGADPDVALDQVLSAERALQLAPGEYPSGAPEVAVAIGSAKGRVLLRRGELTAAHDALEESTRVAETARLTDATHELQGLTALVEAMSGHLRRAADLAVRLGVPEVVPGEAAGPEGRLEEAAVAAHSPAATLALAWVRTDECDAAAAQWLVGSVETARHSADTALLTSVAALLRARLAAGRGEFALAAAELRAVCADGTPTGDDWWDRSLVAAEAWCLLGQGRPDEVLALLADDESSGHVEIGLVLRRARLAAGQALPDTSEPGTRPVPTSAPLGTQVDYRILEAAQAVRQGDPGRGAEHLGRALRLAGPELLRRPFLEAPDEVGTLLEQSGLSADNPWLRLPDAEPEAGPAPPPERTVAHVAAGAGPTAVVPLVSPLTGKEQEVLGLLGRPAHHRRDRSDPVRLGQHRPQPRPQHPAQARGHPPQPGGQAGLGAGPAAAAAGRLSRRPGRLSRRRRREPGESPPRCARGRRSAPGARAERPRSRSRGRS